MGSYAFSGQYQQTPTPSGGGMFKKWWWRYWKPKGIDLPPVRVKNEKGDYVEIEAVEIPESFDEVAQSWDMAFKSNKDNDFVGGSIWGKRDADRYLLDFAKKRAEFTESLTMIRSLTTKYPNARRKLIEDKANGPAVISTLKHEISGLIPYNPGADSKEARAFAVTPQVESGNVYLPHPALYEWVDEYIEVCAKFPKVAHDEEVDVMSQMLNYWSNAPKIRIGWA
jgi:predicted phage terminase large subunit-like protein